MAEHWRTVDWRSEVRDADLLGEIERSVHARLTALSHLTWLSDERAPLLDRLVPSGASALERIDTVSRAAEELDRSSVDQRDAFFAGLVSSTEPRSLPGIA